MLSPNTHFFFFFQQSRLAHFFCPRFYSIFVGLFSRFIFFSVLISSQSSLYFSMFFSLLSLLFFFEYYHQPVCQFLCSLNQQAQHSTKDSLHDELAPPLSDSFLLLKLLYWHIICLIFQCSWHVGCVCVCFFYSSLLNR